MGRVLPLLHACLWIHPPIHPFILCWISSFFGNFVGPIQRSWFRPLLSIRVREQPSFILYCVYTRAIVTCHYLLSTNCTNDDRYLNHFFLVSDGNAAGTGPGDPWTGGSGGVQPPYSGYAPPHLAQPAYPMHLPHDPMVRRLSLVPFFPSSLRSREASIPSLSFFSFRLIR